MNLQRFVFSCHFVTSRNEANCCVTHLNRSRYGYVMRFFAHGVITWYAAIHSLVFVNESVHAQVCLHETPKFRCPRNAYRIVACLTNQRNCLASARKRCEIVECGQARATKSSQPHRSRFVTYCRNEISLIDKASILAQSHTGK